MANPVGSSHGASRQRATTRGPAASISISSDVSSTSTKICPCPSATANSGLPPKGSVCASTPVAASIAEVSWLPPLNVNTRRVTGSSTMARGWCTTETRDSMPAISEDRGLYRRIAGAVAGVALAGFGHQRDSVRAACRDASRSPSRFGMRARDDHHVGRSGNVKSEAVRIEGRVKCHPPSPPRTVSCAVW